MDGGITDTERTTMLRAAVAKVGRDELKNALDRASDPHVRIPTPIVNALNALRKHRDPTTAVTTVPFRAALPFVAAAIAEPCLERTVELLGEHADDPTEEQLNEALAQIDPIFPTTTVAVMLASVAADSALPASDLCFGLLSTDERFGLTGWSEFETPTPSQPKPVVGVTTPEQRRERRLRKQREAEERRRRQEAARKAGEQVRRARKKERSQSEDEPGGPSGTRGATRGGPPGGVAPRLTRRAQLTPVQEQDFDRQDAWVAGVVFAWVPFDPVDAADPVAPSGDGKVRPCVVIAGSPTQLLVRPGYSDGGVKSRDWKSVPVRHWRQSGFDQPTWIGIEVVEVPRPSDQPVGWLSPDDWNSLW